MFLFSQVGDGTTSVVILAGELLGLAEQFLEARMHPVVIIQAYKLALDDAISILQEQLRLVSIMYNMKGM